MAAFAIFVSAFIWLTCGLIEGMPAQELGFLTLALLCPFLLPMFCYDAYYRCGMAGWWAAGGHMSVLELTGPRAVVKMALAPLIACNTGAIVDCTPEPMR